MEGWVDGFMDWSMNVCLCYVCMYACMYVMCNCTRLTNTYGHIHILREKLHSSEI